MKLFPATQDKDVSFHLLHQSDHSRVKFKRVCAAEDREVAPDELVKAYEISKGKYIEVTDDELEAVALKSKHIIQIDEFVPKKEVNDLYHLRPYYIAPEGDVGKDAFVVIRDIIARMDRIALGRIALTR